MSDTPRTLDAKWLDPECWEGCQSLIFKQKISQLERELAEAKQQIAGLQEDKERLTKLECHLASGKGMHYYRSVDGYQFKLAGEFNMMVPYSESLRLAIDNARREGK